MKNEEIAFIANENNPLWTDNKFHNNGLDNNFSDLGLGAVTGNPNDNGKFKTPSLNLEFTALTCMMEDLYN